MPDRENGTEVVLRGAGEAGLEEGGRREEFEGVDVVDVVAALRIEVGFVVRTADLPAHPILPNERLLESGRSLPRTPRHHLKALRFQLLHPAGQPLPGHTLVGLDLVRADMDKGRHLGVEQLGELIKEVGNNLAHLRLIHPREPEGAAEARSVTGDIELGQHRNAQTLGVGNQLLELGLRVEAVGAVKIFGARELRVALGLQPPAVVVGDVYL